MKIYEYRIVVGKMRRFFNLWNLPKHAIHSQAQRRGEYISDHQIPSSCAVEKSLWSREMLEFGSQILF